MSDGRKQTAKAQPPIDVDRLKIPRKAYLSMIEHTHKLNLLRKAKGQPVERKPIVKLFCIDCGEFVRDHHRLVKSVRCRPCADSHRLVLETMAQVKKRKIDTGERHVASDGSRTELDLRLMKEAEERAIAEGRSTPIDPTRVICNQARTCKDRGICSHAKPHVCVGTDDCLRARPKRGSNRGTCIDKNLIDNV